MLQFNTQLVCLTGNRIRLPSAMTTDASVCNGWMYYMMVSCSIPETNDSKSSVDHEATSRQASQVLITTAELDGGCKAIVVVAGVL